MGMFPCLFACGYFTPLRLSRFLRLRGVGVVWGWELMVGLTLGTLGLFLKSVRVIVLRMETHVVRGTSPFARTGLVCISSVCVVVRFCRCLFWGVVCVTMGPEGGGC